MSTDINDVLGLSNSQKHQTNTPANQSEDRFPSIERNNIVEELRTIKHLLVGVLITTGIVALVVLIIVIKLSEAGSRFD